MITQSLLHDLLVYEDGQLFWKRRLSNRVNVGDVAGSMGKTGYRYIGIGTRRYREHRLVFLYHHGYLPLCIDHIDRDRSNNRIENLREVSSQGNLANMPLRSDNPSGFRGVSYHKRAGKWRARLTVDNTEFHLGLYSSKEEAYRVYLCNAREWFGEYYRG